MKAVLGLGANLGDKFKNISDAVKIINSLPKTSVDKVSDVYETKPWGYAQQDNFVNICILIETEFSPSVLLGMCLGIESSLGRIRNFKNEPRIIDIDLLLYENFYSDTEELTVPHKFIKQRSFVLVPLNDIIKKNNIFNFDFETEYKNCDKSEVKRTGYEILYK